MKKHLQISMVLMFFFLLGSLVMAQEKTAVAVLDLKGLGLPEQDVQIISSRVRTELVQTGRFTVVEREKMKDILDEQGLQLSGCTNDECVVQAGRLLGVKQMVAGEIGKIGEMYTLTLRLIDVESGKITKTASEDCKCAVEEVLTKSVKNAAAKLAGLTVAAPETKNLIDVQNQQMNEFSREPARRPLRQMVTTKQGKTFNLSDFEVVNIGRIVKLLPGRILVRFKNKNNLGKVPCVIVRFNKNKKDVAFKCRSRISGFKKDLAVVNVAPTCRPDKTDQVLIVKRKQQLTPQGELRKDAHGSR